ncbi:fungal-specific transcription factor domain-containing protein [Aspergillus heterothallicus]
MQNIQLPTARSHANSASQLRPRRAGVPCVRCRQMKVKCNASQKFPAPCSACAKAGERCAVDPAFKRTSKRGQKYRAVYEEAAPAYRTPHSEGSGTEPIGEPSSRPGATLAASEAVVAGVIAELRVGARRSTRFTHEATGVNLISSLVADLIEDYYSHVHPSFPLLADATAILESYEKAPLLFWTVVAIACKDSEKDASDYARLQILVRQLVADILLVGARSIYLVQALILLCVWSCPHEDMNKEPFSMYCALAISMARSLGLHRPQHPFLLFAAKASEIGTPEARSVTWLSCFIVDQWHTARFGVPPSIRIDHTILHAVNTPMPGVPLTIRIQLHIALVASKISTALGECETSPTGLNKDPLQLLPVFETELSMIQDRYATEWSPADEVSFLDARLSLYSYILHHHQQHHNSKTNTITTTQLHSPHELTTQASITARQLLIILTTLPSTLSKTPFHIFRAASYAVFFLLRIIGTATTTPPDPSSSSSSSSSPPFSAIDETSLRNTIRQAYTLLKDLSATANDRRSQCSRVCRIIENMIDYDEWRKEIPFLGKAESFMALNFVADVAARGMVRANMRQHAAAQAAQAAQGAGAGAAQGAQRNGFDIGEGASGGVGGREGGLVPEVETATTGGFELDFSSWDAMEWNVNWAVGDDMLFLGEALGGGPS